jgi:hypothetical protein
VNRRIPHRARWSAGAVAMAVLIGAACGGSDDGTPSGGTRIGPAGGTVVSADGRLTLTIPPGALSTDVPIRVEVVAAEAVPETLRGPRAVYRLEPEGTTFAQPVRVELRSADAPVTDEEGRLRVPGRMLLSLSDAHGLEPLRSPDDPAQIGAMVLRRDQTIALEGLLDHFSFLTEIKYELIAQIQVLSELPIGHRHVAAFAISDGNADLGINRKVHTDDLYAKPVTTGLETHDVSLPPGGAFFETVELGCEAPGVGAYSLSFRTTVEPPPGFPVEEQVGSNGLRFGWMTTPYRELIYIAKPGGVPYIPGVLKVESECKGAKQVSVTCCLPDESCTATDFLDCKERGGRDYAKESCVRLCLTPSACCAPDGSCSLTQAGECNGERYPAIKTCGASFFCPKACDGQPPKTAEITGIIDALRGADSDTAYLGQLLCGVDELTRHSNGVLETQCSGALCVDSSVKTEVTCGQQLTDDLFNNSIFPCGTGKRALTVCPPSPTPLPAGDFHVFAAALDAPVPLADPTNRYQYAFVFDEDGITTNNYQPSPAYPSDFFKDTDRWYEATYAPGTGWSLKASNAKNSNVTPASTNARIIVSANAIVLVVPKAEFSAPHPAYRITTFRHTGDYGTNPPHNWEGDLEPPVARGLTP